MMLKIMKYILVALACVGFSTFVCVLAAALFIGSLAALAVPVCLLLTFALIWLVLSLIPFVKKLVGLKIGIVGVCAVIAVIILIF